MVVLEEDGRPNPRHRVPLEPPWHILILPPIIVLMDMPICPPPVLPLSAAFSSAPSHFIPKPKPTFPFGNVNLMSRKGLVARGTELAGRRRRRGRAGEEPARGHVTAAGPVGGNQSVGILEGITKNGRRQTRERPYRKHKCPPETERQREVKLWTVKLQWPVDLSSGSIGFFRCG